MQRAGCWKSIFVAELPGGGRQLRQRRQRGQRIEQRERKPLQIIGLRKGIKNQSSLLHGRCPVRSGPTATSSMVAFSSSATPATRSYLELRVAGRAGEGDHVADV